MGSELLFPLAFSLALPVAMPIGTPLPLISAALGLAGAVAIMKIVTAFQNMEFRRARFDAQALGKRTPSFALVRLVPLQDIIWRP